MPSADRLNQLFSFLEETPNDAFTLYAIALEYIAKGDKENAIVYLEKTLSTDVNYVATYYQLGKLMEERNVERSKQIYTEGIAKATQQRKMHDANELKQALALLNGEEDEY